MQTSANTTTSNIQPNQVLEVLYPHTQSRADTTTNVSTQQPMTTQQTTTTTTQSTAATTRRPLDLDMTATQIDSTSAPTPIHLTIHPDPEESSGATSTAANSSNAVAYLQSVHPALPVSAAAAAAGSSSTLQQPQPTRERRNSEGAATSLNGLWTPMSTEAQQTQIQTQRSPAPVHGDQIYASESPIIPARPLQGSVVTTNVHDNQYYDNRARVDRDVAAVAGVGATAAGVAASRAAYTTELPSTTQGERVQHVDQVSGIGRTTLPVGMAATGPLVVGETREMGGVEQVRQVQHVSGVTGERVAVASMAQHQMPASQVFTSTTGPQIVHGANLAYNSSHSSAMGTPYTQRLDEVSSASSISQVDNAAALTGQRLAIAGLAAGPLVVGETRELGGGQQLQQVEDVSRLSQAERVAVASMSQHQMPASQTFSSTTAPQVVMVPGVATSSSSVHGDQVYSSQAPVIPARPLQGSVVTTNVHDNQYYDNRARVDRDAALAAGAAVGTAAAYGQVHSQQLDETAGQSVVQMSDATNLQGGMRTPLVVDSVSGGPLVVGRTQQVGGVEQLREVDDLSRLSQAERVAVASAQQRAMPSPQVFTSTSGSQITQVDNAASLTGQRLAVAGLAAGPLVVGETRELGGGQQLQQVDDVSRLSQAERVAVASTAQHQMPSNQVFTSTTGPQIVHSADAAAYNASHTTAMGTPYTQRLDGMSSASSISHVDNTASFSGERLAVAALAAGPMVVGETRQLGGGQQLQQVDDVSRLSHAERVAVASAAQRAMPSNQVFTSTSGTSIQQVDDVSSLSTAQRLALASDSASATGVMHTTPLTTTVGESIRHVSNTAGLQSGVPVAVGAMAAGPMVVGATQQVGGGEQLQQVDDVSRLSHAERLGLASAPQRAMPSSQVFTSTTGPQIVHTGNTAAYDASQTRSVAMGTAYSQRLDEVNSASSITQVNNTASLSGERLALAGLAAGPMVVGETREVGSGEQVQQVGDVSRLSHAERVAVTAATHQHMPSNQVFTSTTPSIVQVNNTSSLSGQRIDVGGAAHGPLVMGATQQVGGGASNIMQVNEMRGERLALNNAATQSTTGALRTHELSSVSQPQISYTNQATAHQHVQAAQAAQAVQQTTQTTHITQQVPVTTERTTITHEPISAAEAAAQTTVRPLHQRHPTINYADGTQSTLDVTTEQPTYEHRTERVEGGPVQVLHVDAARLAGKEQLGSEAFSVAKEADALSGGMKGMQLDEREQASYRKEEL